MTGLLLLCVDATAVLCLWMFNASLTGPRRLKKVRADPQLWVCDRDRGRCVADGDNRVGIGGLGSHGGGGSLTMPSFAHAFGLPSPARLTSQF